LSVTCFNVELEQFLAWFRIAQVCQLQLGILVWLNCTKFGQLVLMKIIKIVATNGQILRVKCTQFDFGWGSARDPAVPWWRQSISPGGLWCRRHAHAYPQL